MSGGGGSQTQVVQSEMPQWMQDAARQNLARADFVADIGYTPYYGPDVAAMTPAQTTAMQSTGAGMSALGFAPQGFDPMAGQPQPQTFMGGLQAYSSGNLFDQAKAELAQRAPAQYGAIQGMFLDPVTGAKGMHFSPSGASVDPAVAMSIPVMPVSDSSGGGAPASGGGSSDNGAFQGASRLITNPLLTALGQSYNENSALGKVLNPLGTGLGYLADRAIYAAGGEYNDDHDLYLQRGDIMLGRGSVDPTAAFDAYKAQQAEIARQEEVAAAQAAAQAAQDARRAAAVQAAAQPAPTYSNGGDSSGSNGNTWSGSDWSPSSPSVGSGGGNASRGFSYGGW